MDQPAKKRAATTGSWRPGISGNPAGRKPSGETLADAYRAKFPPERIVELAERLATTADSEQVRLQALSMISERAHGKVASVLDATMRQGEAAPARDWSAVPIEERRELIAKLRAVPLAEPEHRLHEPRVPDEDPPIAHRSPTDSEG